MEDRNRNMNDQYSRDNDRDRNWHDTQNEWNRQQNSNSGTYGNVYNRNQDRQYDYDRNWNDRNSDYRGNQGWSNESGQRSNMRNENRYNQDNDWNRNQGGSSRAGMYGSDFGRRGASDMSSGFGYGMSFDDRNDNSYGTSSGIGQQRGTDRSRYTENRNENRYGGDTRNYGNANHGGWDRDWWDRTRDEVSSWFGDSDAERRRRADRVQSGQYRGKGPKGYSRSDERVLEDVCSRLSDDDYIDATNIEVKVEGGEVTLTGTVNEREQKRRAEDLVERISGVRDVENHIKVRRDEDSRSSW
jgi:osmotically-inducible protein OsmY